MTDFEGRIEAARPDSHFFTRLFSFAILAAMSVVAVSLAVAGAGPVHAG